MQTNKRGFALVEVLVVVVLFAVVAGILILAINPGKQLADARNSQRRVDVNTILSAIHQYASDNSGNLPTIPTGSCELVAENQICKSAATGKCSSGVSLTVLTVGGNYLPSLPADPKASNANGTGYYISKTANGRVTVCAPSAEGVVVSATR